MTSIALEQLPPRLANLVRQHAAALISDPTKDQRYRATQLGSAVASYLSWKENEQGAAATTLDTYERVLARLAVAVDKPLPHVTLADLRAVRDDFTRGQRRKATAIIRDFFRWAYEEERIRDNPAGRMRATAQRFGRFANNDIRYRDGNHPNQTQFTPSYVLDPVRVDLDGIGLDPCTTGDNPVDALRFYTIEDDGLAQPWSGPEWSPAIFVNPPYSKAREPWVKRCIEAGARGQKVILLIPAATDTRIFQGAVSTSTAVVFVKGRVKFGTLRPNRRQHAASHPSALIGWNVGLNACSTLGWRAHGKP